MGTTSWKQSIWNCNGELEEKKLMNFQAQTFFETEPISPCSFCTFWASKINKVELCTQIILSTVLHESTACWSHIPFAPLLYCYGEDCMWSTEQNNNRTKNQIISNALVITTPSRLHDPHKRVHKTLTWSLNSCWCFLLHDREILFPNRLPFHSSYWHQTQSHQPG